MTHQTGRALARCRAGLLRAFFVTAFVLSTTSIVSLSASAQQGPGAVPKATNVIEPSAITAVSGIDGRVTGPNLSVGLYDDLVVQVDGNAPLDPPQWTLYLDRQPLEGITASDWDGRRGLVFRLARTEANKARWAELLGSPSFTGREVQVALGRKGGSAQQVTMLHGIHADTAVVRVNGLATGSLLLAAALAAFVLYLVYNASVRTPILRDNLIPQLPTELRTFSLGRCQMAFWFTLVVISYLFIWVLTRDYNVMTQGAVTLMGISAATGFGAILANDHNKDQLDQAKNALDAAKITTVEEFVDLRERINNNGTVSDPTSGVSLKTFCPFSLLGCG